MISGLGVDLVDIQRFSDTTTASMKRFLARVFTVDEQEYCLSKADPGTHFAGTFAAKEALYKASAHAVSIEQFEIRRSVSGQPEVWFDGKKADDMLVSISHTDTTACAVAIMNHE